MTLKQSEGFEEYVELQLPSGEVVTLTEIEYHGDAGEWADELVYLYDPYTRRNDGFGFTPVLVAEQFIELYGGKIIEIEWPVLQADQVD